MHLFDGLDFMLMPKFAGFYLSPPVYRITPTNRLLSYRATGFGGDYGFFQFRIRIISVSLKKELRSRFRIEYITIQWERGNALLHCQG